MNEINNKTTENEMTSMNRMQHTLPSPFSSHVSCWYFFQKVSSSETISCPIKRSFKQAAESQREELPGTDYRKFELCSGDLICPCCLFWDAAVCWVLPFCQNGLLMVGCKTQQDRQSKTRGGKVLFVGIRMHKTRKNVSLKMPNTNVMLGKHK